jgi:2,4-diaminopentanoate dehydrogenase
MAMRVVHFGTGNVGRIALRQLIADPRFELTGVWVSSDAKVGKDAGELARIGITTGITATKDMGSLLAGQPDCAVYCAVGDNRVGEALADLRCILGAGINVVSSAPTVLQYPYGVLPQRLIASLEDTAKTHQVSLFVNGIDPGFVNDLIPLAFASTCQHVEQIRCTEMADYASYDGATVMFDVMGFGARPDALPPLLQPGVLSMAWGSAIRAMGAVLDVEVDGITDSSELEWASEDFDIAAGHIPRGGVAAMRFEICGWSRGKRALVIEHVTRLRPDQRPDWPQPAQEGGSYRVEIVGEPSFVVDICQTSALGDHNYAAIAAGAGRIVNAIPAVVAAEPGLHTALDLPLISGRGLPRSNTSGSLTLSSPKPKRVH